MTYNSAYFWFKKKVSSYNYIWIWWATQIYDSMQKNGRSVSENYEALNLSIVETPAFCLIEENQNWLCNVSALNQVSEFLSAVAGRPWSAKVVVKQSRVQQLPATAKTPWERVQIHPVAVASEKQIDLILHRVAPSCLPASTYTHSLTAS